MCLPVYEAQHVGCIKMLSNENRASTGIRMIEGADNYRPNNSIRTCYIDITTLLCKQIGNVFNLTELK